MINDSYAHMVLFDHCSQSLCLEYVTSFSDIRTDYEKMMF